MLIWLLIFIFGFIFTKGSYAYFDIFILLAALIILPLLLYFSQRQQSLSSLIKPNAYLILLIVLSLQTYGGLYQQDFVFLSYCLLFFSLLISALLLIKINLFQTKFLCSLLFLAAILLRLLMVWSSPNPHIDVFETLKNGASGLINGINPYSNIYPQMYQGIVPDYYPYPPTTLLLTAPIVWIFHDPRYAMILSEIVVSFIIFKVIKKSPNKYIFSLIWLFNPISPLIIEQSFTEPLVLCLLAILIFLTNKKKYYWAAVTFGFSLALKQYIILLLPLFFRITIISKKYYRLIFISLVTATLIILPFIFWAKDDFMQDVIYYQFNVTPFYKSLTFNSLLSEIGITSNLIYGYLIILLGGIFIYKQKIINPSYFFYLAALLFFIFFFFNKWASINYYYLIAQLFLLGIVFDEKQFSQAK